MKLDKEFYTINEVAGLFGVTRTTVYDWMGNGRLRYVVIGARRRVTREALEAFIQSGDDNTSGVAKEGSDRRAPLFAAAPA